MNLSIDSYLAYFRYDPEGFQRLIDRLERMGYQPLVRKAAQGFSDIFGATSDWKPEMLESDDKEEMQHLTELNRRRLLALEKLGYNWGIGGIRGLAKVPGLKGELFESLDGKGMLFLSVLEFEQRADQDEHPTASLRAGLVGDIENGGAELNRFLTSIAEFLFENGSDIEWEQDQVESQQYREFMAAQSNAGFTLADSVNQKELHSARALEDINAREVAQVVRKYGTILAKDLINHSGGKGIDARKPIEQLLQANLFKQEYIVVCSKTGAHVNRAESRDTIEQMAKLGVLCSCGKHISEEPIESIISSDVMMLKLLEKSNWLTAAIIRVLTSLGVPAEKVILNPSLSGEDSEVITDIGGMLLMFGLQDNEFALPQALSFGARIAMHRPQLAFVVSGRGITNEAKEHFKRVKNDTQLVYVSNLDELEPTVKQVVEGLRLNRVRAMFNALQSMVNFNLTPLISRRFHPASSISSVGVSSQSATTTSSSANLLKQAPSTAGPTFSRTSREPAATPERKAIELPSSAPVPQAVTPLAPAHIVEELAHHSEHQMTASAPAALVPPAPAPSPALAISTPPPAQVASSSAIVTPPSVQVAPAVVTPPPPQAAPSPVIVTPPPPQAIPSSAPVTAAAAPAPAIAPPVPAQAAVPHPVPTRSIPVHAVQSYDFDSEETIPLQAVNAASVENSSRRLGASNSEVQADTAPPSEHPVKTESASHEVAQGETAAPRAVFTMPGPVTNPPAVTREGNGHQQVFNMSGPTEVPGPVVGHEVYRAPEHEFETVERAEQNVQAAQHPPAPEVPASNYAPEPKVYSMPGPIAQQMPDSYEISVPDAQAQPYFQSQAADSAPKGQDAWDSLSSILANAAAKENVPSVAQEQVPVTSDSLPTLPRSNGGLKLSLFGAHDEDDEFENSGNPSVDHGITEEQEEERRNRLAAIRGLSNSN